MMKRAEKILCLDANLDDNVIMYFLQLMDYRTTPHIIINERQNVYDNIFIYHDPGNIMKKIIECI